MLCKQLNSNKAHRAIEILYTQYQDSQVTYICEYLYNNAIQHTSRYLLYTIYTILFYACCMFDMTLLCIIYYAIYVYIHQTYTNLTPNLPQINTSPIHPYIQVMFLQEVGSSFIRRFESESTPTTLSSHRDDSLGQNYDSIISTSI